MKKNKCLALALSLLLLLSSSSCQSKKDTEEADGTRLQNGEISPQNDDNQNGGVSPQMTLTRDGDTVLADTPYFSISQVDVYEAQPGEDIQMQGCAVTEQGIYILLSIYDYEKMNTFYENADAENWSPEEEDKMLMDAEKESFRTELFILDTEGQLKTNIDFRSSMPEEVEHIYKIFASNSGELFLAGTGVYDESIDGQENIIIKIDADGNPIGELIKMNPQEGERKELKNYFSIAQDSSGNFFTYGYAYPKNEWEGRNFFEVLDSQGKLLFSLDPESDQLGNVGQWQFNEIFFTNQDTVYKVTNYNTLVPFFADEQKPGEEIEVDIYLDKATIKEQKIYSCDSSGIYSFDLESKQKENLFLWKDLDSEILNYDARPYIMSDDKVFLPVSSVDYWTMGDLNLAFYLLTRQESNPHAGKTIIQIGGYEINNPALSEIIRNFNIQNNDCRVELLDFTFSDEIQSEIDDFTGLQRELNMKFLLGEIPDILIGRPIFINFPLYASKDLFADLTTFMENDASFKKEDYLDIMHTLPAADDKLYYTFTSFSIDGVITKKSMLNGKDGWTLAEMESILESAPDGKAFFTNASHSEILYWLLKPSLSSIVDIPSRTSNLNSDYFKGILNLCKKYGVSEEEWNSRMQMMMESPSMDWPSSPKQIRNGEIAFAFDSTRVVDHWKSTWNQSGSDITMVGFPGENDHKIVCNPHEFVAIAASGKNQDAAWEIVKELFSLNGQKDIIDGFPVQREALELAIAKEQEMDNIDDIDLTEMPEFTPLSDEGAQELREIIQSASIMSSEDSQIQDIIRQETGAFFAGQKDIDETVRVIQDRVTTYLNQL